MLFTTLTRNLLLLFTVSLSLVFFVSCQREVEEILEESPEPDPDPDPSGKKLKAVYVLEDIGGWDTVTIFQFKYDGQGRLQTMERKSQTDSFYVRLSLFYQGTDKYPYLVTDSSYENWGDADLDSTFIFYDQQGRIIKDSTLRWKSDYTNPAAMYFEQLMKHQLTYATNNSIVGKRTSTWFNLSGAADSYEDVDIEMNILQNNANVYEQDYFEQDVVGSGNSWDYIKAEFSQYRNPYKGLFPPYPKLLYSAYMGMEGDFSNFYSRVVYDDVDIYGENVRYTVESHIDSFPTRARLDFYNVPGWVEMHLFEYE